MKIENLPDLIQRNLPGITHIAIAPDAMLDDLGADVLTRHGLALDITNETGREVSEQEADGWVSVSDVMKSYETASDVSEAAV